MANYDTITNMLRQMQDTKQASGQMMLEKAKAQGQGIQGLVEGMKDVAGTIIAKRAQQRKDEAEMARQQAGIQAQKEMSAEDRALQERISAEREATTRGDIRYSNFPPSGESDKDKRLLLSPTANQVLKEIGGDRYVTYDPTTGMEKLNYEALLKDKDTILQRARLQLDNMVTAGLDSAQAKNTLRELELALQGQSAGVNEQATIPSATGQERNVTGAQIDRYAKSFLSPYNQTYRNMTGQISSGNMEAANKSAESIKASISGSTLPAPVKQGLIDRFLKTLAELGLQNTSVMGPFNIPTLRSRNKQ